MVAGDGAGHLTGCCEMLDMVAKSLLPSSSLTSCLVFGSTKNLKTANQKQQASK